MDLSDPHSRDRGGRRRRRRGDGARRDRDRDHDTTPPPPAPARQPIILAKSSTDQSHQQGHQQLPPSASSSPSRSKQAEKPVVVLRSSRDEGRPTTPATSVPNITASISGETTSQPQHSTHRNPPVSMLTDLPVQTKLVLPPEMTRSMKLIDETFNWCDSATEMLLDKTDFFVVGVVGLQGSGKSTIMSFLAGNSPHDPLRNFVFQPQSKDTRELGGHQTVGVDIYVTPERIIYLDVQPLLSCSVLDRIINQDRKYPTEFTTAENCVEMQCLQLVTFLMTVCNVILVVQDWFLDINLIRILQVAEMLKPSTPSSGHEGAQGQDDSPDYFPHTVFIQNKSVREDFSAENYTDMVGTLSRLFKGSKLKLRGGVSTATSKQVSGLSSKSVDSEFNLCILPQTDKTKILSTDSVLNGIPDYRGYPSFNSLIRSLQQQLYSMPRNMLTHTVLSERNWFHYSARIWDAVKKSQLMSEYNRLLP